MKDKDRWTKAAERYELAKQPGFKPKKKIVKPAPKAPTLAEFLANGRCEAAMRLLKASGDYVQLAVSEKVMGHNSTLSFDSEGFRLSHQVAGEAAAYSKESPRAERVNATEALEFAERNRDEPYDIDVEEKMVRKIIEGLDDIARHAP